MANEIKSPPVRAGQSLNSVAGGLDGETITPPSQPRKRSLRAAVNEKCKDCIYDPAAVGNWRQQVHSCTCTDCPLHPYRPTSQSSKNGHFGPGNEPSGDVCKGGEDG